MSNDTKGQRGSRDLTADKVLVGDLPAEMQQFVRRVARAFRVEYAVGEYLERRRGIGELRRICREG